MKIASFQVSIYSLSSISMSDNESIFLKHEEPQYEAIKVEWEIIDSFTNGSLIEHSPIFSFAENKWMLYLSRKDNSIWLQLSNIISNDEPRERFKCVLGVKKTDGDLIYFPKFTSSFSSGGIFFDLRDILTFSTNLTVVCTLRHTCHFGAPSTSRVHTPLKLLKFDALSQNFKKLFADKDSCDVILRVKEKVLNAHKAVLVARSPVFASMFHHDMSEKQTGIVTLSDCDPDSFQKFLEYLYSGELNDASFHDIRHLYIISDKYDVQDLKSFCIKYIKKCLTEDNMGDILMFAEMYDGAKLFKAVQEFFNRDAYKVLETAQWQNLMKNNYPLANRLIKGLIRHLE